MDNIAFGLQITLIGMGLVFSLLLLLWALLAVLGRLDKTPAETPAASVEPRIDSIEGNTAGLTEDEVAAVVVAVLAHAAARRRQAAPAMRSAWPGSQMYASRWLAAGRTRQTLTWSRKR